MTFLEELAEQILQKHRDHLNDLVVVLPGKRASQFLSLAIHQKNHFGWLPKMVTLSELIEQMSGARRADTFDLQFELFLVWKQHFNKHDSFGEFLQWGPTVLSDFNEIDHHLLVAADVYRNLRSFKDLENWSFGEEEHLWSTEQKRFADFWDKLYPLYTAFQDHQAKSAAWQGGALARKVAQDPITAFDRLKAKHLIVAGLNALTPAEQHIIGTLEKTGRATMIWDADRYYVHDQQLEAGHFIREIEKRGFSSKVQSNLLSRLNKVSLTGCSSSIVQMQYVHEVLDKVEPGDALKTAVILPDNSVLPALLPAIPEKFNGINVTMGKALSHTPYKSLLFHFFRLFDKGGKKVYHASFLSFLRHPYLGGMPTKKGENPFRSIAQHVATNNLVFIGRNDVLENLQKRGAVHNKTVLLFEKIFDALAERSTSSMLDALKTLLPVIAIEKERQTDQAERYQGWRLLNDLFQKISRLHERYPVMTENRELERVTMKLFAKLQVDLIGEPLSGLQIMGLLESRALDFDRVIILSANEGVLPKQQSIESTLPWEIRAAFSLPNRQDRDAIFAYYFYRLLQRSKEVHVVYNSGGSSHKTGEKSRYVQQLEHCRMLRGAGIEITENQRMSAVPQEQPHIPEILPAAWSDLRLQELLNRGMSPSAINKWTTCPSDFYFRYILGLREQDDVEEEMENNTLGSLVHDVLEKGLDQLVGSPLKTEDLMQLRSRLEDLTDEALDRIYRRELTASGLNYLSRQVILRFARQLIDNEMKALETHGIELVMLEGELRKTLVNAAIYGKADRIDRFDSVLRVVDYKSGKVEAKDLQLAGDWKGQLMSGNKGKALQTMVYAWLAWHKLEEPVKAGIISMRNHRSGFQALKIDKRDVIMDGQLAIEVEAWLHEVLKAIDMRVTTCTHHKDARYCEYCVSLES